MKKSKTAKSAVVDAPEIVVPEIVEDEPKSTRGYKQRATKADKADAFGSLVVTAVNGLTKSLDTACGIPEGGLSESERDGLRLTSTILYESGDGAKLTQNMGKLSVGLFALTVAGIILPRAYLLFKTWRAQSGASQQAAEHGV